MADSFREILVVFIQRYMKKIIQFKGKTITIRDFTPVIPWEHLEPIMGKGNTKNFMKWLGGQTVSSKGVYPEDLARWLDGREVID